MAREDTVGWSGVTTPEDPPGFVVRTEAQKAAWDNGFRLERGIAAGWLRYASTTAAGEVWIAGVSDKGPWLLSLDHGGAADELADLAVAPIAGPGIATFVFDGLSGLHAALDRTYRLSLSLPDAPLRTFEKAVATLPKTTEAERLVVQRIGQDIFRDALLKYWGGRCPITGVAAPRLLRASHIKPWAACDTDAERLDVHNGLLLAAHLDAAFDAGLISFADDGAMLFAAAFTAADRAALGLHEGLSLPRLTYHHRGNLAWHRTYIFARA